MMENYSWNLRCKHIPVIFIALFIVNYNRALYLVRMINLSFVGKKLIIIIGKNHKNIDCIWAGLVA